MKVFRRKLIAPRINKSALIFIGLLYVTPLYSQSLIKGRIIDRADNTPIANASIFLGNTTIGAQTRVDGRFTLDHIKAGKYELIVSVVGFQTYNQPLTVTESETVLPDIEMIRQVKTLDGVTIRYKADPNRELYYQWFKKQFLGTSELADDCVVVNPEMLDLQYDEEKRVLTASSIDFLKIENQALGYRLNYLITDFTDNNADTSRHELHFTGTVLFENMKGTAGQVRRWQKRRQEIYEGSEFHFLRAAASDRIEEEGFTP